jgi:hypothetical protein
MKRPLLLVTIFLLQLGYGYTQTITPAVLNSTGGTFTHDLYSLDWSVGELALVNTQKSMNGQVIITNGFLQPSAWIKTQPKTDGNRFTADEVTILPNPTYGKVEVNVLTEQKGTLFFTVYDVAGRVVLQKNAISSGIGNTEKLDLGLQPQGSYLLKIILVPAPGSVSKSITYKVLKI